VRFNFGEYTTDVFISREIPALGEISGGSPDGIVICDENTSAIADKITGAEKLPQCVLKSGEENKNRDSVFKILSVAFNAGLGRDSSFIAVGGGVIGDLAGFASSIYMRGCRFVFVCTTLLGMVDASIGGKTGFDLFGIKNLAGSFYPAQKVFLPVGCLSSLPLKEWKSGMAELIKTAILDGDDFLEEIAALLPEKTSAFADPLILLDDARFVECVKRSALYKGGVASEDFRESGKRALLNLGHTFAHALEAAAGLGNVTHGEAVAWGIACACKLGVFLGVTPQERAEKIKSLIVSFGYDCECPHPLIGDTDMFINAMKSDKKKKDGKLVFIVPGAQSAVPVVLEPENGALEKIIKGESVC
jgi:3-dehydroquinate synthase